MYILLRAVLGQIVTVVANVLMMCLLSCLAMLLTPFSTQYSFFAYIAQLPLADQLQMAFTGFSSKRYMLGQDGARKPLRSCLTVVSLAFVGLVFTFLSTIVFQVSHTELGNSVTTNPNVISSEQMKSVEKTNTAGTQITYPVLQDMFLGPAAQNEAESNLHKTRTILPSKYWESNIGLPTQTASQFSGSVYVSMTDVNWMSIATTTDSTNLTTSVYINLSGITAEGLAQTTPGTVSVQVFNNSMPVDFDLPYVDETSTNGGTSGNQQNTYAFAIDGVSTLDYVQFSLVKFDAQEWATDTNLADYYAYLEAQAPFVNKNGTLLFNHTYDYSTMKSYDTAQLESDLQVGGDTAVRYALISARNTTSEGDLFQTFAVTKRSAYRQTTANTSYGTIDLVEYHYLVQITRFAKTGNLKDGFKVKVTTDSETTATAFSVPVTPFFRSAQSDYINMASLTGLNGIYTAYTPETYIDMIPIIILISAYIGTTLGLVIFALFWNWHRFQDKAYSIPLQLLNYIFFSPGNTLHPLLDKVSGVELSMADGYDPNLGYNHLGLMAVEDAKRITVAEPDVPYGQIYKGRKDSGATGEV